MLAKSSYKLKKYGECLFAVSKAASAIARKDKFTPVGKLARSNQKKASSPIKADKQASLDDEEPQSDTVFTPDSSIQRKLPPSHQQTEEVLSIQELQEGNGEGRRGAASSSVTVDTFVDCQGNLNELGQIQLGYLKAKCLCKLKRFSESLF